MHGQAAGIHAGNPGDVKPLHGLPKGLGAAEIGGCVIVFMDDHGGDRGTLRFEILRAYSVVADERVGHDHRLTGIGGIGQDFLIARHGSVEHDFRHPIPLGTEAVSGIGGSVLQNYLSVIGSDHFCVTSFRFADSFCSN